MSDLRKAAADFLREYDEGIYDEDFIRAINAIRAALAASEPVRGEPTPRITRITCGFVDVRFDGERWFCGKCGERMPANYEAMVKHYSGDRDYLELMQRKALEKYGRHLDDCALPLGGYQCTCGFNQQEVPR